MDLEEELVRRRSPSRALRLGVGAAALAFAGIVAALVALPRARRMREAPAATIASIVPSSVAVTARPAVAAVAPPAAVPDVPALPVAPVAPVAAVASAARAASQHAAAGAPIPRFSPAAAQRTINSVVHQVARCRRGKFWGNGYATVVFTNDGSVDRVLVNPPFSMTVTGKCVADALGSKHMRPFAGRIGYYRFRFYIAQR